MTAPWTLLPPPFILDYCSCGTCASLACFPAGLGGHKAESAEVSDVLPK